MGPSSQGDKHEDLISVKLVPKTNKAVWLKVTQEDVYFPRAPRATIPKVHGMYTHSMRHNGMRSHVFTRSLRPRGWKANRRACSIGQWCNPAALSSTHDLHALTGYTCGVASLMTSGRLLLGLQNVATPDAKQMSA